MASSQSPIDPFSHFADLFEIPPTVVGSSAPKLCRECQQIDINKFFPDREVAVSDHGHGIVIATLGHIIESRDCRLCEFLCNMRREEDVLSSIEYESRLTLRQFSANSTFGITGQTNLADVSLLAVVEMFVKNRTIPVSARDEYVSAYIMASKCHERALSGRKLDPNIVSYSVVGSWLSFCVQHHGQACSKNNELRGLLVIDCDSRQIIPANDQNLPYVALSYLWGPDAGQDQVSRNMLPTTLPQVIEDAITVTKRLGFKCLWVDRYCVSEGTAKHEQILNMGKIYANAVLTIVAATGDDSHYGLPGVSIPRKSQPCLQLGDQLLVSTMPNIALEIQSSKWNTRGWTYQEALLSSRRLVFTQSQVYFQCASSHCLESIRAPLKSLHNRRLTRFFDSINMYRVFPREGVGKFVFEIQNRISEYNERNLSFDYDALNAFEGILTGFQSMKPPVEHFLGLPLFSSESFTMINQPITELDRLVQGLRWNMSSTAVRRPAFPSWTWLGWRGSGFRIEDLVQMRKSSIGVVSDMWGTMRCIEIAVESAAPYPNILDVPSSGHLRYLDLQAYLLPFLYHRKDSDAAWKFEYQGWAFLPGVMEMVLRCAGENDTTLSSVAGLILNYHYRYKANPLVSFIIIHEVSQNQEPKHYERLCDGLRQDDLGEVKYDRSEPGGKIWINGLELHPQRIKLG